MNKLFITTVNVRVSSAAVGCGESELNAEQIVSQFADFAGLDLADVFTNYTQYANDIQHSFIRHQRALC